MMFNEVNDFLQTTLAIIFISTTAWYLIQFFTGNQHKIKELITLQIVFASGIIIFKQLLASIDMGTDQLFECTQIMSSQSLRTKEDIHKIWNCQGFAIYYDATKTFIEYVFELNILKNIDQKAIIIGLIVYNLAWGFIQDTSLSTRNILKTLLGSFICLFLLTSGSQIVASVLTAFNQMGDSDAFRNAVELKSLVHNIFVIENDIDSIGIFDQVSLFFLKFISSLFIGILFLSDLLNIIFILIIEITLSYLPIFGIVAMLMGNFRYQTIFMMLGIAVFFGSISFLGLSSLGMGEILNYSNLVKKIELSSNQSSTILTVAVQLAGSGALFIIITIITFFLAFVISTKSVLRNVLGR